MGPAGRDRPRQRPRGWWGGRRAARGGSAAAATGTGRRRRGRFSLGPLLPPPGQVSTHCFSASLAPPAAGLSLRRSDQMSYTEPECGGGSANVRPAGSAKQRSGAARPGSSSSSSAAGAVSALAARASFPAPSGPAAAAGGNVLHGQLDRLMAAAAARVAEQRKQDGAVSEDIRALKVRAARLISTSANRPSLQAGPRAGRNALFGQLWRGTTWSELAARRGLNVVARACAGRVHDAGGRAPRDAQPQDARGVRHRVLHRCRRRPPGRPGRRRQRGGQRHEHGRRGGRGGARRAARGRCGCEREVRWRCERAAAGAGRAQGGGGAAGGFRRAARRRGQR